MGTFHNACLELQNVLGQVDHECQSILVQLNAFRTYVADYALDKLRLRLLTIGNWIIRSVESLYKQHDGGGYVCIFMRENGGLGIHWVEDKEIVADRAWFKARGSTVLSEDEAISIIVLLIDELTKRDWARVVYWINRYGMRIDL